ncbi:MAG TPA: OmpA family protein [Aliidongia sp.]|nr:OmpA family protein [Aliidongia sp.]
MRCGNLLGLAGLMLLSACAGHKDETASSNAYGTSAESGYAGGAGQQNAGVGAGAYGSPEALAAELRASDHILFATDQSSVSPEAKLVLQRQAMVLARYPQQSFMIEGHADERGTREYNLALGDRRARAARDALVGFGVPAARLTTVSYGKERPAVVGDSEAALAQNRRAVTVVSQ